MPSIINEGVTIHYRVEGIGPPLVLQHGFTDSSETWYEFGYVKVLKSKYRIILPDARGHGQSDKPHDPLAYTPKNFADDIVAILDDIGVNRVCYWGYSHGGWLAFAVAQYAPERIAAFVIGGAASTGSAYPTEPGKEDPMIAVLRRGLGNLVNVYGEWATPALEKRLLSNDAAALIACRQQRIASEGFANAGTIAVPAFFYAGGSDPIHDSARQTAAEISGAEFVSLPGLTHVAAMCQPHLILPEVERFLEKAGLS